MIKRHTCIWPSLWWAGDGSWDSRGIPASTWEAADSRRPDHTCQWLWRLSDNWARHFFRPRHHLCLRFQKEEVGDTESNGILEVTFSFSNAMQLYIQRFYQSKTVLPLWALQKIIIDVDWWVCVGYRRYSHYGEEEDMEEVGLEEMHSIAHIPLVKLVYVGGREHWQIWSVDEQLFPKGNSVPRKKKHVFDEQLPPLTQLNLCLKKDCVKRLYTIFQCNCLWSLGQYYSLDNIIINLKLHLRFHFG